MRAVIQPDLFAPLPDGRPPGRRSAPRARRRRVADTTLAAGADGVPDRRAHVDETVLTEIKAAGPVGRTRKEIVRRTPIEIQSLCWSLDRLLKREEIFRPLIGIRDDQRPLYLARNREQVFVAALYRERFLPKPGSIADALAVAEAR